MNNFALRTFIYFLVVLSFFSFLNNHILLAQPTFSFKIPLGQPTLPFPRDVAVDSIGNIYVISASSNDIVKLSPAGDEILRIGSFGSADAQFSIPQGVTVDSSDNIIVSDTGNNRIQVFNSAGVHQLSFGSFGSADGQLNNPQKVTVDSLDNIIVADSANNRIQGPM